MTSRRSFLFGAGGAVAFGALAACGDGPPGASEGGHGGGHNGAGQAEDVAPDTILIKNFAFVPAEITVAPGTMLLVDNQDTAPHTVTATDDSFDTGNLDGKQRGTIAAPREPGSYPYICDIHQYMTGTLTMAAS